VQRMMNDSWKKRLAPDARAMLRKARALALREGFSLVRNTHVALAIQADYGGAAGFLLRDVVASVRGLEEALRAQLRMDASAGARGALSDETTRLLRGAVRLARRYRVSLVGSEFVLLRLATDAESPLLAAFLACGVQAADLRRYIGERLGLGHGGIAARIGFPIRRVRLIELPPDVRLDPAARVFVRCEQRLTDHQLSKTDAYAKALRLGPRTPDQLHELVAQFYAAQVRTLQEQDLDE